MRTGTAFESIETCVNSTHAHTDTAGSTPLHATIEGEPPVHSTFRTTPRRRSMLVTVAVLGVALVAAACGNKKDDGGTVDTGGTQPQTEVTVAATDGGGEPGQNDSTESTTEASAATSDDAVPEYGGVLVAAGESEVANAWVPAKMQCDAYCLQRARSFYDQVAALGDDLEIHPFLAESITPNDDSTVWTIKIRDGISFHDDTPVDADAVMYNLEATGSDLLVSAAIKDVARNEDGTLLMEKLDDLTFTIATGFNGDPNQPISWPGLDTYLAGQWGLIASPTWLRAVDAGEADPVLAVGSGPFMVDSFTSRESLVLRRNPNYWQSAPNGDQLPYLDGIEYLVIEDSEIAAEALQSGDIDMFATSSGLVINGFRGNTSFNMIEQTELGDTNYLLIDLAKDGALADVRVRCAMSKAIDRQEMIDAVAAGILAPANGVFSPGQQGYLDDNGFDIEQDIDGAKSLIDEYEAEFGEATITYGKTVTQVNDQIAQLLKGYWQEIGLDVEILTIPQDQIITNALFGSPEFEIYGWRQHAGVSVDSQYFWWHSSGAAPDGELSLNMARIRDEVVDTALETARRSSDPDARLQAAETVNRRFAEQCYQIPWSWGMWGIPHDPIVHTGNTVLPDGTPISDATNFSGFYWSHDIWLGS